MIINLSGIINSLEQLGAHSPLYIMGYIFIHGGWIIFLVFLLWVAHELWLNYVQEKFNAKRKWILLSISVPKENEQGPKAVENIFSHLAGAHASQNWYDRYVEGKIQDWFSLEIVSTNGYTQFLIRTITKFRNLVEASIYAQYPDAEIVEVPDYTEGFPDKFPNDEYDLWGTEFILVNKECYPIRTYPMFEDTTSKDYKFKDPMAAMLENFSRLGKGEHAWFQIILIPIEQKKWKARGEQEVQKLIGANIKTKKNIADYISGVSSKAIEGLGNVASTSESASTIPKREERQESSRILYLTPGERLVVEGIQRKLSKIGFRVKMRGIYVARREVFEKSRAAHPMIGAIKQFNTVDMNSIKPEYKKVGTGGLIFWKTRRTNARKTKIMAAYKSRSFWAGVHEGSVFNIEELASLYHFPVLGVKAPLLKKTVAKKGEPPAFLPFTEEEKEETSKVEGGEIAEGDAPENLPIEIE